MLTASDNRLESLPNVAAAARRRDLPPFPTILRLRSPAARH